MNDVSDGIYIVDERMYVFVDISLYIVKWMLIEKIKRRC